MNLHSTHHEKAEITITACESHSNGLPPIHVHGFLAVLYHAFLPPLGCAMVDFGRDGIRCRLPAERSDEFLISEWKSAIEIGTEVDVEIVMPGETVRVHVDAHGVDPAGEHESYCALSFHGLDADQTALIDRAIRFFESRAHESDKMPSETQTGSFGRLTASLTKHAPAGTKSPVASLSGMLLSAVCGLCDTVYHFEHARVDYRSMRLEEILVAHGRISKERLEDACRQAHAEHIQLGRYLVREKLISPTEWCRALALQSGLPIVHLNGIEPNSTALRRFTTRMMKELCFVPFNECGDTVYIACAQPLADSALEKLQHHSHRRVKQFLTHDDDVASFLNNFFSSASSCCKLPAVQTLHN